MNVSMLSNLSSSFPVSTDYAWEIEKSYNDSYWINWFENYWKVSPILGVIYIVVIRLTSEWMKSRKRFELNGPLFFWNVSLAVFSILGAFRTIPEILVDFGTNGWIHSTVCTRDKITITFEFWGLLFVLSKALELGDTVFIVLRKQSLIFLHWYHHITVLCYTWYTYAGKPSTSPSFGAMNYLVHAVMYSYYALKSLRLPVPRKVSMLITLLQLAQMALGIGVNLYSVYAKLILESKCTVHMEHAVLALLMYGSYLVLFADFFSKSYLSKIKSKVQ